MFVDGDFQVQWAECQYFCSPTCHPAQIGPEWVYGCTNEKHPHFVEGDFVPIVECRGEISKCMCKPPANKALERDLKNAGDVL